MSDSFPSESGPSVDRDLAALLADESMWDPVDPAVEDAIVAAIAAEAEPAGAVTPISAARGWRGLVVAGAAAIVLVVAAVVAFDDGAEPAGVELALTPTDLAPEASGLVLVAETPLGTRLVLDVAGLPPAAAGRYYEAWLRTGPETGVSAGTFHLRGGDGEIELWAGVAVVDYPLFTITIQDEGDPQSSGQVVLRGRVGE